MVLEEDLSHNTAIAGVGQQQHDHHHQHSAIINNADQHPPAVLLPAANQQQQQTMQNEMPLPSSQRLEYGVDKATDQSGPRLPTTELNDRQQEAAGNLVEDDAYYYTVANTKTEEESWGRKLCGAFAGFLFPRLTPIPWSSFVLLSIFVAIP